MLIGRRSFLRGLIAAPIIVSPGIIMPVRPLFDPRPDITAAFRDNAAEIGTMIVQGKDAFGHDVVEWIRPGKRGQKNFNFITSIEYVGGGKYKPHPFAGVPGSYTGVNMRRPT